MTVRVKLVVIVVFAALVPLSVSAVTALRVHRTAFDSATADLRTGTARAGATLVTERLDAVERTVRQAASSIPWAELSPPERDGALWLLYRQLDSIAVASLLDAAGSGVGSSAYLGSDDDDDDLVGHPRAPSALLTAFAAAIPFATAAADRGYGTAFDVESQPGVFLAVATEVPGPRDAPWTVAVAVGLDELCSTLMELPTGGLDVAVVDDRDRVVCEANQPAALRPVPGAFVTGSDRHELVVRAPVAHGWSVVATQPRADATASSRDMRNQTLFWIGISIAVALAAGLVLASAISRPVAALATGAEALAAGDLGHRLAVDGRDELAELARTFNHMASELQTRNDEIERWNRELVQRVEDRTQELRDAQQQLLQSQKIAAMSSLAAGVAHEINNPLAGVLGLAQVLKMRARRDDARAVDVDTLGKIEAEARRIRDIVQTLLGLSEEQAGKGFAAVGLDDVIDDTLRNAGENLADRAIAVERAIALDAAPVRGNRTQLGQVLLHLIANAAAAMDSGGTLSLELEKLDAELVRLNVRDTGCGIPADALDRVYEPFFTTKQDWRGRGLGLAVSYRIIEEHHGTMKIHSTVGEGTTVTITLPAFSGAAHLV